MQLLALVAEHNEIVCEAASMSTEFPVPEEPSIVECMQPKEDEWVDYSVYRDTVTSTPLRTDLVHKGMQEELEYMQKKQLWNRFDTWQEAVDEVHRRGQEVDATVAGKWVVTNKGDHNAPDVRCRMVACEVAYGKTTATEADYFAPTPPLEAMKASLAKFDPEGIPVPYFMSGGTDNKALSEIGIVGYGFSPLRLPADLDFMSLFHGVDERVPIDGLRFGVRVLNDFLESC